MTQHAPSCSTVAGVGYELSHPSCRPRPCARCAAAKSSCGSQTHLREDASNLFGFANETIGASFVCCWAVPRSARRPHWGVLSSLSVEDLARPLRAWLSCAPRKCPRVGNRRPSGWFWSSGKAPRHLRARPRFWGGVTHRTLGNEAARLLKRARDRAIGLAEAEPSVSARGRERDTNRSETCLPSPRPDLTP